MSNFWGAYQVRVLISVSTRTYFHEYSVLTIEVNYKWVKQDILTLVASEIEREWPEPKGAD